MQKIIIMVLDFWYLSRSEEIKLKKAKFKARNAMLY